MGWPKHLFGFFHNILRKNPNELSGQPNISSVEAMCDISDFHHEPAPSPFPDSRVQAFQSIILDSTPAPWSTLAPFSRFSWGYRIRDNYVVSPSFLLLPPIFSLLSKTLVLIME